MVRDVVFRLALVGLLLIFTGMSAFAGGPVCPPKMCGPVCAPPPPMCGPLPICGPAPCPPLAACPPPGPMCGPPPPRNCRETPLAKIVNGTIMVACGVVALPFKLVDCVIEGLSGPPKCGPAYQGPPPAACMPPAPPMCGPAPCAPGVAPGMYPPGRPVGMGYGPPRSKRFAPFAEERTAPEHHLAAPAGSIFGAYW
jgi:hypothetical protein